MKHDVPERYALAFRLYPYVQSPDQRAAAPVRHKAVFVIDELVNGAAGPT